MGLLIYLLIGFGVGTFMAKYILSKDKEITEGDGKLLFMLYFFMSIIFWPLAISSVGVYGYLRWLGVFKKEE